MTYTRKQAQFDEALLEHYDELGLHGEYQATLRRMRQNGYEPKGTGAPLPGSAYYNDRDESWD